MLVDKKGDGGQQRTSPTQTFVLADIGGTTSRFALFRDRQLGEIAHMHDADFPSFSDALRHFLDRQDARPKVDVALFAVAGFLWVKLGFNPAPLLLGFVLGPKLEEYLRRAMLMSEGDVTVFVRHPISLAFIVATALILLALIVPALRKRRDEVAS